MLQAKTLSVRLMGFLGRLKETLKPWFGLTVGLEKFVETFEMTAIDDKEDYAKTIEAKLGGEFSWYSKLGEGFKKKAKGYVEFDNTFQREKFQDAVEETLKKLCTEYKLSLVLIIARERVDFEVWKEK